MGEASAQTGRNAVLVAIGQQIAWCRNLGSPFTAEVVSALADDIAAGGTTAGLVDGWPGDPVADALPLRLAGALHSLALSGDNVRLAGHYPSVTAASPEIDRPALRAAILASLAERADIVRAFIASPPQTNEVGRSAVLLGGFLRVAATTGLPLRLLEIGASAGLNLLWDRFRYHLGTARWGDQASPVLLSPNWSGPTPPVAEPLRVAERRGCDIAPIDLEDPAQRLRLRSYVWADQTDRLRRLDGAMTLARAAGTIVERADAADWVEALTRERAEGRVTVLYHSIMWQYLQPASHPRRGHENHEAGGRARRRGGALGVAPFRARRPPRSPGPPPHDLARPTRRAPRDRAGPWRPGDLAGRRKPFVLTLDVGGRACAAVAALRGRAAAVTLPATSATRETAMLATIAAFDRMGEENAFAVLARATELSRQGRDVVNLGIGQPDFATPPNVVEAAVRALRDGHHGYTAATGILPLREALSADLHRRFAVEVSPEKIVVVPGGKVTMFAAILMFGEPGAEIVYPDPGFPIYRSMIEFTGAKPVPLPMREANGFAFSGAEALSLIGPRTRLVILNSPANPTGGVTPKPEIDALVAGLDRFPDAAVLSDEIYGQMTYDGLAHTSLLSYPSIRDRLIMLDGWSKTYAMTGWRMGYAVWPDVLVDRMRKLAVNSYSCVNAPAQWAGLEALTGPQDAVAAMVEEFDRRRRVVVAGLNRLPGVSAATPKGAFYAFPNVAGTGWRSKPLASALLEEAGIATIGGPDFGVHGEGYIRLSYANSLPNIERALARMADFLSTRRPSGTEAVA